MYSNVCVNFIGNLTRDPELKDVNGNKVCSFAVAANNGEKNEAGVFEADYYNCSAWGKTGEYLMTKLQKGTQVYICGDLRIKPYISTTDNTARSDNRVTVLNVACLARQKQTEQTEEKTE